MKRKERIKKVTLKSMLWAWFVALATFALSVILMFAGLYYGGKYLMTWELDIAQGVGLMAVEFAYPISLAHGVFAVYRYAKDHNMDIPSPAAVWRVWRS